MKKNINYLLRSSLAILLLSGCSKSFNERSPKDAVPLANALTTEADLQAAVNGLYASLRSTALFGNALLVEGDLLADNSFVETNNSGRYVTSYQYNFIAEDGELGQIWRAAYTSILNANFIINATPTTTKAAQLKAQALAVRALLYFKLVNLYARPYTDNPNGLGVPLVLTYDAYKLPARNTVAEVYAQMIKDLQTAFTTAPDYSSSISISKYFAEALLAKVYLYMGNNTAAKTAALDVINNSGFTLVPATSYAAYWANASAQTFRVETLFELDADAITNNGYEDIAYLYNGYSDVYASMQLYNLYAATDVRQSVLVPGATKSGAPAITINKFPNAASADRDNLKVMRLPEVYLIAAEASLAGNEVDARTYLNAIATVRDPSFTGYTATTTGAALLDAIVLERRKELAFEGDRFSDLNRLKKDIVRSTNAGAIQAGTANVNLTIPYTSTRRILPIPQSEILANAAIKGQQNPGY
jgi:starch-binding outer membrane protein, SusD/RagB family